MNKTLQKILATGGIIALVGTSSPSLETIAEAQYNKPYYGQIATKHEKYELTKEKMQFLKETKLSKQLEKHRYIFIEYADKIRKAELTKNPLLDCKLLIYSHNIVPLDEMKRISNKYGKTMQELEGLIAAYGLSIIDGMPNYLPTQKGLILLKETGLLDRINQSWDQIKEEYGEIIRKKRQSGKPYGDELAKILLDEYMPSVSTLVEIASKHDVSTYPLLGTVTAFIDTKLFEQESNKLNNYPTYTKLENKK